MAAPKGNKNAKGNKGGGRLSLYKPEYADLAFKYSLLSATDEQLAEFFDVGLTTINKWKKDHIEFNEALKRGKFQADAEITNSLYQRAKGFTRKETDIRVIDGKIVLTEIEKYYPADTTAGIYWLNNRQRAKFKARQSEEDAPPVIITVNVTKEETKQIAKELRNEFLQIA